MSNQYAQLNNPNDNPPAFAPQQPQQLNYAQPYGQPMYQPQQQPQPVYAAPVYNNQPIYQPPVLVAGQPAYIVQVGANIPMGQPGHVAPGMFSDGLFDCFDSCRICIVAWCLAPLRFAQTMERLRFMTFMNALLVYGTPWLIMYICDFILQVTLVVYLVIPVILFNFVQIYLGMVYRTKIREHYLIPGSQCEDCLLHTFCRCCALAQEGRHVDRDFAFPL